MKRSVRELEAMVDEAAHEVSLLRFEYKAKQNEYETAADEIERLRGIVQFGETASRQQREGLQAEVERLKAALREVADSDVHWRAVNVARVALAAQEPGK